MIPEFLCHSIQVQTQYVKLDLCKSIFTKDNELAESFSPVVQCTSHHTSLKNFFHSSSFQNKLAQKYYLQTKSVPTFGGWGREQTSLQ